MQTVFTNDFKLKPENAENVNWTYAGGFCFDERGKVCVVFEKAKDYWCLPGGGKHEGETPQQNFLREVLEETQAQVNMKSLKYFHAICGQTGEEIIYGFRYICQLKNIEEFMPNAGGHEIDERKFVGIDELPEYITWLKDSENGRESYELLKKYKIDNNF